MLFCSGHLSYEPDLACMLVGGIIHQVRPLFFGKLFLAADRRSVRQVGGVAFGLGRAVIGYGIPVKLREKTATSMRL